MGKLDPYEEVGLIQTLVWPNVTYGAEAWILSKDLRCSIEAFETQCYRMSMKISYTKYVTNKRFWNVLLASISASCSLSYVR